MSNNKNYVIVAVIMVLAASSTALSDERYRPIKDETTLSECGACHLAFQPQMLPKRSWAKIMNTLSDHFGEDASLDVATSNHIKTYLEDNAADAGWWSGKFLRGIGDDMTPLRITETPYWVREHKKEVSDRAWRDPRVKTKANCAACHPRASSGNYDDD